MLDQVVVRQNFVCNTHPYTTAASLTSNQIFDYHRMVASQHPQPMRVFLWN